jgi:chorismate mutase
MVLSRELCVKLIRLGRAAYVREATRFKSTLDTIDVPARDNQVIDEAVGNASHFHLPENMAFAVFSAVINSSVPFEKCVFDSFGG